MFGIPLTAFHVRWYHGYSTVAFLVANLWNFQLNRMWTFRSTHHARWWKEYWPFLAVGLLGRATRSTTPAGSGPASTGRS